MSLFKRTRPALDATDAGLVMASLGGDRDAFCLIVERYQRLLCSLAYSSVGDIKHSEDIAQDAFVEAWKKLDTLKEPQKLKSWLCGILRFKVSHYRRKEEHQPVKSAEDIDDHIEVACEQEKPEGKAIREQQQAILWRTLEQLPENYREPLVLFYREQQSVSHVASELDLTEEVVKQRLSRGRKLLQSAMVSFVEESLKNTAPGVAFTASVFAAIQLIPAPAQAAALGSGAAKAGSILKWSGLITLIASFSGFISAFFGIKAGLAQSRTTREKKHVIVTSTLFITIAVVFIGGMYLLKYLAQAASSPGTYAVVSQVVVVLFAASYIWLCIVMFKKTQTIRQQERIFNPDAFTHERDQPNAKQREFISRIRLLGVPLFHFRFGVPEIHDKPIFAWVAGGDRAYGLLFAWGGIAVAPICVGVVAVGGLGIGAVGIGLLGLGTVAIGAVAFGASAIGIKAYASLSSLGWQCAFSNGFSIAQNAAVGPYAFAEQVNNEAAYKIAELALLQQSYLWLLGLIAVGVIVPAVLHWREVKRRMG